MIVEQLATAIKASVAHISEKAIPGKKGEAFEFTQEPMPKLALRGQVIENATALRHFLCSKNLKGVHVYPDSDLRCKLLVIGNGATYRAVVVEAGVITPVIYVKFLDSGDFASADAAIKRLFEITAFLLDQQTSEALRSQMDEHVRRLPGGGGYWL